MFVPFKYEKEEEMDFEYFERLAKHFPSTFQNYKHTKSGAFYDVQAYGKEHILNVELKLRGKDTEKYPDCYIELKKWDNMLTDWRINGKLPIYINFIGGPDNVYIWNLSEIEHPLRFVPNTEIDGEKVDRIGLKWDDALHYKYNCNNNKYFKVLKK